MVYVRQSNPQQVKDHKESGALQYELFRLATDLGWSPDRVEVIDDDQGHTAEFAEGRLGFQRLLAEVSLDHVGLIVGIEMSRLARSCKDWYQLLERMFSLRNNSGGSRRESMIPRTTTTASFWGSKGR